MGPLEKLKAFGLSPMDIPSAAYMGIRDSFSPKFAEHAVDYNVAANQFYNESGAHDEKYNRSKGFYGGLDYALRFGRSKEDAEKVARLYQLKQSLQRGVYSDPKQDLLDLEANLAGIDHGEKNKHLKPSQGVILDSDNYESLLELARQYAKGSMK